MKTVRSKNWNEYLQVPESSSGNDNLLEKSVHQKLKKIVLTVLSVLICPLFGKELLRWILKTVTLHFWSDDTWQCSIYNYFIYNLEITSHVKHLIWWSTIWIERYNATRADNLSKSKKWSRYFFEIIPNSLFSGCSKLNPIQDGLFRGCSPMEGSKRPPSLKSVTHILQWWSLAQLYLT